MINVANAKVLLMGLGNVLMQDEGIGVHAVEAFECRYHLPAGVAAIDGGTTGTELLQPMRGKEHLIIADAVNTGAPPGTLVRIADDEVPAFFQTKISSHQLGLSDLLAVLTVTGEMPKAITIIGLVPYLLENEFGLSTKAKGKIGPMVEMLVAELRSLGLEPRERHQPSRGFWAASPIVGVAECA